MKHFKFGKKLDMEKVKQKKNEIINAMKSTKQINLDFSKTKYIDIIGLGMLISLYKISITKKVSIKIINIDPNIEKVFRVVGLDYLYFSDGCA